MGLFRQTLVLVLIAAAGVVFPLRRAQQAFGARPSTLGFAATRKPMMRRRVGGPRFDFKLAGDARKRDGGDHRAGVPRVARRRLTFASAAAAGQFRAHALRAHHHAPPVARASAPSEAKHAPAHAAAHLDCEVPPPPDRLPRPLRLNVPTLAPPLTAAAQASGDTPVPPPRHFLILA